MLLLNNQDVERLLSMKDCIEVIEEAYRELGSGMAANFPEGGRMDVQAPSPGPEPERCYIWGGLAGVVPKREIFALRIKSDIRYPELNIEGVPTHKKFCIAPGTYCGLVLLFSTRTAEPLAIVNDGIIQHLRVAATSGVAAKFLARKNSETLGMIGSGGMARTHTLAFCEVLPIKRVKIFSPTPSHRLEFAREMSDRLGIEVRAVERPEEAVKDVDLLSSCTDSLSQVVKEDWLQPGMHVACVLPFEVEPKAVKKMDVVVRHLKGGAVGVKAAAAELNEHERTRRKLYEQYGAPLEQREDLPTLAEIASGHRPGRTDDRQITYFHNVPGSGIQFAAVGARLLELAKKAGVGRELPTDWFLQDIRD
ncbi:MAG: ornithine cyclodeaminase family protein [Deltaproteobacteria bacterium]|nr:ornithine cyclodeaminase family protein [Deltaproteobacteria bacterium]